MAVGEAGGGDPADVGGASRAGEARGFEWTLALLPAFPIVLLVLRLWHLSRQDLNTMLLLVQNVGPLDLAGSLVITFLWVPPVFLLTGHALGLLYQVSVRKPVRRERRSWLERTVDRTPDWAVAVTVMWSALAWQLRFLPALAMVTCAIVGLTVRRRRLGQDRLILGVCFLLPIGVAAGEYLWFAPAIAEAFSRGEIALALLLLLPPALAPLLTGSIPAPVAFVATHWPAAAGVLFAPFVLLVIFLRAPVLPSVALELDAPAGEVLLGSVVSVDDTMTTLLDDQGSVRFVPNDNIASKALCQGPEQIPYSAVTAHGWHVESSALDWLLPAKQPQGTRDPRCEGRLP